MRLQARIEALRPKIKHVGGPLHVFEEAGRHQLILCLREGLNPGSKVLDIGCGCLRAGYWLIHFLDPDCYFGIEPSQEVLEAGTTYVLEPETLEAKKPVFDHNAQFDCSMFGEVFDFFLARSIWTHTAKTQIQAMLDSFARHAAPDGVFLTSYHRAGILRNRDYQGTEWVGFSHESEKPGHVYHRLSWVQAECRQRGLCVEELSARELNFGDQTWLRITRSGSSLRRAQ